MTLLMRLLFLFALAAAFVAYDTRGEYRAILYKTAQMTVAETLRSVPMERWECYERARKRQRTTEAGC
jgi:hypothetical protein